MPHPKVKYIATSDRPYNGFDGPGWYFADPGDDDDLNIEGPYQTEELATSEYHAYCSIMTD